MFFFDAGDLATMLLVAQDNKLSGPGIDANCRLGAE
jgi:hypothetical protein